MIEFYYYHQYIITNALLYIAIGVCIYLPLIPKIKAAGGTSGAFIMGVLSWPAPLAVMLYKGVRYLCKRVCKRGANALKFDDIPQNKRVPWVSVEIDHKPEMIIGVEGRCHHSSGTFSKDIEDLKNLTIREGREPGEFIITREEIPAHSNRGSHQNTLPLNWGFGIVEKGSHSLLKDLSDDLHVDLATMFFHDDLIVEPGTSERLQRYVQRWLKIRIPSGRIPASVSVLENNNFFYITLEW